MLAAVTRQEEQSLPTLSWDLGSALNGTSSHSHPPDREERSLDPSRQTNQSFG